MLPELNDISVTQLVSDTFGGYNAGVVIADGEFSDTENITNDYYPAISQRGKRGSVFTLTTPNGIYAKTSLVYVDGTKLYYNGVEVSGITLINSEKQFCGIGAYLVIFPDKKYINTADLTEYGDLGASFTSSGTVSFSLCKADGALYGAYTTSDSAPASPSNGDLWCDTSLAAPSLKQYSSSSASWVVIPATYIRITNTGIGAAFSEMDAIEISGCTNADYNGNFTIYDKGDDYIVIQGILTQSITQATALTVERKIPDMEFLVESNNRIWGCSSANHEIYCCALGDPKNWNRYLGISTDSYAATVGTDGDFTGAAAHLGYILFFKENCVHKVLGTQPENFQITSHNIDGVEAGSEKSLVVINGTLYYKSPNGICSYDGNYPTNISGNLGAGRFSNAVAGTINNKYYVSMVRDSAYSLWVYDTLRGTWMHEDSTQVKQYSTWDNCLYYIGSDNKIHIENSDEYTGAWTVTQEGDITWSLTTGNVGYSYPDHKHVGKTIIRISLASGSVCNIAFQYDDGSFSRKYHIIGKGETRAYSAVFCPRRCDHFKIKLYGTGSFKLITIVKYLEVGDGI